MRDVRFSEMPKGMVGMFNTMLSPFGLLFIQEIDESGTLQGLTLGRTEPKGMDPVARREAWRAAARQMGLINR